MFLPSGTVNLGVGTVNLGVGTVNLGVGTVFLPFGTVFLGFGTVFVLIHITNVPIYHSVFKERCFWRISDLKIFFFAFHFCRGQKK